MFGAKKEGVTGSELSAHIYKIPDNYYEINAGNIDFSNYPDGIENDYLTIRITNLQSLFSLPINFIDFKDITPDNLTTTFEAIGKAVLDIQKRLSDVAIYVDNGTPGQINLPKLPIGCVWYRDQNDNISALPITTLYDEFDNLINYLRQDIRKLLDEDYEELSQDLRDKTDELLAELSRLNTQITEYITQLGNGYINNINTAGTTQVGAVNTAGATQVQNVINEGDKQVQRVKTQGDTEVERINKTGIDGKQDKIDQRLQGTTKDVVENINESFWRVIPKRIGNENTNSSLDDYTTAGEFVSALYNNKWSDNPVQSSANGGAFWLTVKDLMSGAKLQRIIGYIDRRILIRAYYTNTGWTKWEEEISNSKLFLGTAGITALKFIGENAIKEAEKGYYDELTGELYYCFKEAPATVTTPNKDYFIKATNIENSKQSIKTYLNYYKETSSYNYKYNNVSYNESTREITILEEGLYSVSSDIYISGSYTTSCGLSLTLNNVIFSSTNGWGARASTTGVVYCNKGDKIKSNPSDNPILFNFSCVKIK